MLPDGSEERFLTQRVQCPWEHAFQSVHLYIWAQAHEKFNALVEALRGYEAVDIEQELVIYDSNLRLDEGWI